ncbi:MAG: hypothetical protein HUU35_12170, partial [Armatimonadetes bacterium]|nr:hypothetical protein [Armatimonadota bacterium]
LTANSRIVVTPGARFSLTGWAKLMQPGGVQLAAVGYAGGQVVSWSVGGARSSAVGSWQELVATVTVPAPVDTLVVRWTGNGPTDACLDEVALTPLP